MPPYRSNEQNTQDDDVRPTHGMRTRSRARTLEFVATKGVLPAPTSPPQAPRTDVNYL